MTLGSTFVLVALEQVYQAYGGLDGAEGKLGRDERYPGGAL